MEEHCEILNIKLGKIVDTVDSIAFSQDTLLDGKKFISFSTDVKYTITNSCKYKNMYIIGFDQYLLYVKKEHFIVEFIEIV